MGFEGIDHTASDEFSSHDFLSLQHEIETSISPTLQKYIDCISDIQSSKRDMKKLLQSSPLTAGEINQLLTRIGRKQGTMNFSPDAQEILISHIVSQLPDPNKKPLHIPLEDREKQYYPELVAQQEHSTTGIALSVHNKLTLFLHAQSLKNSQSETGLHDTTTARRKKRNDTTRS